MTRIYPFQRTARWLSLGFLAVALLLGSWITASAQEPAQKEPRQNDPRLEALSKKKVTVDMTGENPVVEEEPEAAVESLSPHHAMLEKLAGHWAAQIRIHMGPEADPVDTHGVARNEMVLNGHALRMDYKGEFMGEPFVGLGYDGYDLDAEEHFSVWMDTSSTGVTRETGVGCSHDGRDVITFNGEARDPANGKMTKTKTVLTLISSSRYTIEQWKVPEEGEPDLAMQIIFSRK